MKGAYDHLLVKQFREKTLREVLDASPSALKGVSPGDAAMLEAAFGIKSIESLAQSQAFRKARTLLTVLEGRFDSGPPLHWERFFAGAPLDHYVQHPSGRFRLDFGPVFYRGRLDGSARLLVIGQDPSTNEILAGRVFVGRSGQRVQGFLSKLGLTRSYTLLNVFLFSVFGQFDSQLRSISLEQPVISYRNAFLDRLVKENPVQAVLAIGRAARHALENWPGAQDFPTFHITHPAAPDEAALLASWNQALPGLQSHVDRDPEGQKDTVGYGSTFEEEDIVSIPSQDLPFGLPEWHGTGSHSHRDGNKKIIWTAP